MNSPNVSSIPPEVYKQDKGPTLLIVTWLFASLALAAVSIKVWTRCKILHRSGIDDYLIIFAWLISLIYGALLTASVRLGLGKHPYAIEPSKMSQMLKLYTMATPFGILVLALPTLAIAIVLADLIGSTRRHTWILYLFPVLQILIGIIGIILLFTQCKPASTLWRAQPGPRCLDPSRMTGYVYFMSVYVAFVDVLLAVVPLAAFWKLQIKSTAKVALLLVMSATVLAAICALVRLAYVASLSDVQDYTYASVNHTIWAVIEGNVIIIAACIPGLRLLVKHVLSRSDRPPPLPLQPKSTQHDLSVASTALPSPLSLRRMEPRSSGSVSGSLSAPAAKVYRQNSLARIESTVAAAEETDRSQPEQGEEEEGKLNPDGNDEENEERRGRTGRMEAGEAVEVDGRDIGPIGDAERDSQVQELREILEENRIEDRQSWLIKMRERVDKRMTI